MGLRELKVLSSGILSTLHNVSSPQTSVNLHVCSRFQKTRQCRRRVFSKSHIFFLRHNNPLEESVTSLQNILVSNFNNAGK